jgi:hypothetical protein
VDTSHVGVVSEHLVSNILGDSFIDSHHTGFLGGGELVPILLILFFGFQFLYFFYKLTENYVESSHWPPIGLQIVRWNGFIYRCCLIDFLAVFFFPPFSCWFFPLPSLSNLPPPWAFGFSILSWWEFILLDYLLRSLIRDWSWRNLKDHRLIAPHAVRFIIVSVPTKVLTVFYFSWNWRLALKWFISLAIIETFEIACRWSD